MKLKYIIPTYIALIWLVMLLITSTADASIVANWSFNEGSGTWANDTSGNHNNGSVSGASWVNDAVNSKALSFNGVNARVNVSHSASLNTSSMSIGFWVKTNATAEQTIFDKIGTGAGYYISINEGGAGNIYFRLNDGVNPIAGGFGGAINDNKWHHIQWIINKSVTAPSLYIDGVSFDITPFGDMTVIGNYNNTVNITLGANGSFFNGILDEVRLYNHALSSSERTELFQQAHPVLSYPTDGIIINATYPPMITTINFSWQDTNYPSDRIIVAKDSAFNIIVIDQHTSNDFYSSTLESGYTYYWKVQQYNSTSGAYGDTSTTTSFTISVTTPTVSTTAIYGVAYKLDDNLIVPLSDIEVRLWDNMSSISYSVITGSNGYFLFENLKNYTTYYIQAKKPSEYDDSAVELITTGLGTQTEIGLLMVDCTVAYNCFYGKVNLKLIVADIWTNTYENVAIAVYAGSDVIASYTGTTGSDGSETFSLVKTQQYRITFINSTQGISETRTITPGDQNELYVIVSPSGGNWWNPPSTVGNTGFTVSTNEINSTHAYVNATYTDNLAASTWTIYLNQTNHSNGTAPQIMLQSTTGSNNGTASFMISNYKGTSYLVNLKATHTMLGTVQRSFGVAFEGLQSTALDYISNFMKALISIAIIIFVGAMFGQSSVNQGALIVCGLGWIFLGIGFFAYFDTVKMGAGLLIATVFAVFMNMNARARQEDIS